MVFGNGNFAATMAFTGVLAGATVVTGFAATLPLAVVLALATMFGRRRTTTMAFAGVLAGATIVAGIAASLALAVVHAFARVFITAFVRCFCRINTASLNADKNSSHSAEQQFIEISSFHTHPGISHKSSKRHVCPARGQATHLAARYAAARVSGEVVPNYRGLAEKSIPHGNMGGAIQPNASAYASTWKSRPRAGIAPVVQYVTTLKQDSCYAQKPGVASDFSVSRSRISTRRRTRNSVRHGIPCVMDYVNSLIFKHHRIGTIHATQ